jgi:predicted PurR-regulated permease PerM
VQRKNVKYALLIITTVAIGYLCFLMAAPFLVAIAWAAVLAILLTPVYQSVRTRVRSSNAAALLAVVFAVVVIAAPLVGIGTMVTRSVISLLDAQGIGGGETEITFSDWVAKELDLVSGWATEHLGISNLGELNLTDLVKQIANTLAGQTQRLLGGVAGFFFNLVIVFFTLFFFLRDQDAVLSAVRGFIPLSEENTNAVFDRVHQVIRASVVGGGAVALTQGLLAGIGFAVLGLPSPLLWGALTAFSSFIPFFGAAGIWVPAVIVLLVKGEIVKAIILACFGTFVISLVDNFLRPILIGDATRLHTLLIFFSILGGLQVFGFLGLIMGPVVLAVGLALVDIFRIEMLETEERRRSTGALDERTIAP